MCEFKAGFIAVLLGIFALTNSYADTTDPVIKKEQERLQAGVASQKKIDTIYDSTQALMADYESKLESVASLEVYNRLLKRQLEGQESEMATLENSISDAAVIERRITPLLARMIDSLEMFINADMPFLLAERRARVVDLRELLTRSDVSAAEKCRRVFEAFEIENDFGRSLEAYKSQIEVNGSSHDAEVLRIGRIALMFQLIGQETTGYWSTQDNAWQVDTDGSYRRFVEQGLKVAYKETAPEMINVPISLTAADR